MKHVFKTFIFVLFLSSSLIAQGTVILLNGTSSAGKSSIAQELQKTLGDSFEFVGIDKDVNEPNLNSIIEYVQQKTKEQVTPKNIDVIAEKLIKDGVITQEEIEAFSNQTSTELFKQMIQKIKDFTKDGKNVIFDTLIGDEGEQEIVRAFEQFRGENVLFLLVYCPFQELAKRIAARNIVGGMEQRTFTQVWCQFGGLYKAAKLGDTPILETLSKKTVSDLVQLHARSEFEEEKEFNEFLLELLENLSLNNHETVQITQRYKYDLIVNNATQSPAECAQHIHNFIQQGHACIAFQEIYDALKPGWFGKAKTWVKKTFGRKRRAQPLAWNQANIRARILRG
jgi:chloramphenicol 3-O-phosphotransferase